MSDLISRSELLESFRKSYCGHLGMENSDGMITFRSICRIIKEQPTAYSVDEVVEEFDKKYNNSLWIKGNEEFSITRNELIEIVNQCGVSDDVCEWREHPICGFYSEHIGADRIINIDEYKYCPYCGKKIKVVGD